MFKVDELHKLFHGLMANLSSFIISIILKDYDYNNYNYIYIYFKTTEIGNQAMKQFK